MSERETDEKFLSRWSRLKRTTEREAAEARPPAPVQAEKPVADNAQQQLPPIESLTPDSDYKVFFQPEVDQGVRRAALKKLFSDPHFNVMDGLDTYIDDYSISEPIPPEMLAQMKSAQKIFRWARGESDEEEAPKEEEQAGQVEAAAPAELPQPADNAAVPDKPVLDTGATEPPPVAAALQRDTS